MTIIDYLRYNNRAEDLLNFKSQSQINIIKKRYFCIAKIKYIPVGKAVNYCLKVKCKALRNFSKNHKSMKGR
jgi:hypothetical protein